MAELEVDQSNLPRVQEVCQCFSVLEDGALAHNLQEQEIEQYYNSNVQRSQLVQKDIRVAKRLQDEEQRRAQILQHQATRQLEEQDSEYARMIQEEIQRHAEEARRREVEDEEIAKRIQEEELCVRHRSSSQNQDGRESTSIATHPFTPRPVPTPHSRSQSRRWQRSTSPTYSNSEEDLVEHSRLRVVRRDSRPVERQGRLVGRSSRAHSEQDDQSVASQSSSRSSHLSGGWGDVIKLIKNDMSEQGYLSYSSEDDLFEPVYKLEEILRQKQQVPGARLNRHSSVREDRSRLWQGCNQRESFSERRVHFLDDRRRSNTYHTNGFRTNENGHSDDRERVHNSTRIPRDDHAQHRETQGLQNQDQGFRRNVSMRRSYHGNVRRTSVREGSRTSIDDSNLSRTRLLKDASLTQSVGAEVEDRLRDPGRWEMMGRKNSRQRVRSLAKDDRERRRRVRRSQSERWQAFEEEQRSTDEELEREEGWMRRLQSRRSPRAGPARRSGTAALDLGELEQVLLDEELARRLQDEEDRLAEEPQRDSPPLRRDCVFGDFRAAQVAQDEEIARFMQKQEIKAKQQSRELEPVGPRQEYRETDRRASCDRQRRRLDSEGLQSPVDDFPPDHPNRLSMTVQPQAIRNIAEELDPTFQRKDTAEAGQLNGPGQNQTLQQAGMYSPSEEPTIVPPTKRQCEKLAKSSDKLVKAKEKKENVKQKENCKQQ